MFYLKILHSFFRYRREFAVKFATDEATKILADHIINSYERQAIEIQPGRLQSTATTK